MVTQDDQALFQITHQTWLSISSVQSSPLTYWVMGGGGARGTIQQRSSSEGPCEQYWHGQGCPVFDVVHPAFPLLTTALPTFQGALKDGFAEAVMMCDMPKPCKFLSLPFQSDIQKVCQGRFTHTGQYQSADPWHQFKTTSKSKQEKKKKKKRQRKTYEACSALRFRR